jgi:hypothetical protein
MLSQLVLPSEFVSTRDCVLLNIKDRHRGWIVVYSLLMMGTNFAAVPCTCLGIVAVAALNAPPTDNHNMTSSRILFSLGLTFLVYQ